MLELLRQKALSCSDLNLSGTVAAETHPAQLARQSGRYDRFRELLREVGGDPVSHVSLEKLLEDLEMLL